MHENHGKLDGFRFRFSLSRQRTVCSPEGSTWSLNPPRWRRWASARPVAVHPSSATAEGYLWYVETLGCDMWCMATIGLQIMAFHVISESFQSHFMWFQSHFRVISMIFQSENTMPLAKIDENCHSHSLVIFPILKLVNVTTSGFATGLVWLTPESGNVELLGHVVKNDPVYSGGPVQGVNFIWGVGDRVRK